MVMEGADQAEFLDLARSHRIHVPRIGIAPVAERLDRVVLTLIHVGHTIVAAEIEAAAATQIPARIKAAFLQILMLPGRELAVLLGGEIADVPMTVIVA